VKAKRTGSTNDHNPENIMEEFLAVKSEWEKWALELAAAERSYAHAFGVALANSDGKTEAVRQAQAESHCIDERITRDTARVYEQSARWTVQYIIARDEKQKAGV
jgi:hypothetical protein